MPWVVADYTSPTLDLSDPATYRDLSRPIGALNPRRLADFQARFDELRSMAAAVAGAKLPPGVPAPPDMPPFLYGCHYSSPGYVVFYLMRSDPQLMLRLQVGGAESWLADWPVHRVGERPWRLLAAHTCTPPSQARPLTAPACPPTRAERPLRRARPPLLVHRRHLAERAEPAQRCQGAGAAGARLARPARHAWPPPHVACPPTGGLTLALAACARAAHCTLPHPQVPEFYSNDPSFLVSAPPPWWPPPGLAWAAAAPPRQRAPCPSCALLTHPPPATLPPPTPAS